MQTASKLFEKDLIYVGLVSYVIVLAAMTPAKKFNSFSFILSCILFENIQLSNNYAKLFRILQTSKIVFCLVTFEEAFSFRNKNRELYTHYHRIQYFAAKNF